MELDCVFFDYDGVLTADPTGSITTCRYMSARTGRPLGQVKAAFARHNQGLTLGLITHEDVWPEICAELGLDMPFGVLTDAFDSTPVNRPMFDLARKLRASCRVGIITDNKLDRMHRLVAVQRLDELFDPIIVSAAMGCSKSSPELFERAMAIAQVRAGRSVFIDNNEDNVAMTLKAMSSYGALPPLDEAKVPEAFRTIVKQSFERVVDAAFRESPSSVVEHCRDALQVFISRRLIAEGKDEAIKKEELAPIADVVEKPPYKMVCVGNLARVVARLHGGRGKTNEREDKGTRELTPEDAELTIRAVGFVLADFGWTKA